MKKTYKLHKWQTQTSKKKKTEKEIMLIYKFKFI